MCAIFGLGFKNGHKIKDKDMVVEIINRLFIESQIHGSDASGIATCSTRGITIFKNNIAANKFIETEKYKEVTSIFADLFTADTSRKTQTKPVSIMGHCRLKTKGSEFCNVNNHPIVKKEIIGIHNGHIRNDDELFDFYSDKFDRNGQVDSEIIFALIEHFILNAEANSISEAIKMMAKEVEGALACSMFHRKHPYNIYLFRNYNPCYVKHFEDVGLIIWSTSDHFITKATKGLKIGKFEDLNLQFDGGMELDLYRNRIYRFPIERGHFKHGRFLY